jgi:hypothetical protein
MLMSCWLAALVLYGDTTQSLATEAAGSPLTVSATLQPIPWPQRTLFIPYQLNKQLPASQQIARVQLLISRTGSGDWAILQSAEPNVQGFNYHAPEDGEYWFALKHLDATGQALDGAATVPQLHLVINTQPAAELNPPANAAAITGPTATAPLVSEGGDGSRPPLAASDPFQAAAKTSQDWPANNQLSSAIPSNVPPTNVPPANNSYTATNDSNIRRTPAKFAVDDVGSSNHKAQENFTSDLSADKSDPPDQPAHLPPDTNSEWSSSGPQSGPMLVNARTFDVEYDLQAVGAWGIAKVELWGTLDEGATWQSFGIDPDNRSPIRVTVPHSGTYGFRILVEGTSSIGVTPPQAGDKPELVVMVDVDQPKAMLAGIETGSGNLADQLHIRWSADDKNLEPRPIGLFYSSYAEGPWSTIATGLENSGDYVWRIERHIPGRFFLKLEVRDTAGNVTTCQTPEPIELTRPQPTGTLRSIHPVTDAPAVGS